MWVSSGELRTGLDPEREEGDFRWGFGLRRRRLHPLNLSIYSPEIRVCQRYIKRRHGNQCRAMVKNNHAMESGLGAAVWCYLANHWR